MMMIVVVVISLLNCLCSLLMCSSLTRAFFYVESIALFELENIRRCPALSLRG